MPWGEIVTGVTKIVDALGPIGAFVISIVVGLGIVVVIIAHWHGLYGERRAGEHSLAFVDKLMLQVDKLTEREARLRADLEAQEREADGYRKRALDLQVDVDLMRNQLRRTIELLRSVRAGRLRPGDIADADLAAAVETDTGT